MVQPVLDAVRKVGPQISARSEEIEQLRRLPQDVVDLLVPSKAFKLCAPESLGGPGIGAWPALRVIEETAYHDGATGWCVAIASTTSLLSRYLPDEFATEIYAPEAAITGGFAMPVGRATPVDGGLNVSGRWQWGSGTQHCTWIGGGSLVIGADGTPAPRSDGLMVPFVFFRPDDVEFIDNWHTSGLAGTGSCDYQVNDVFVPEGRWVQTGLDKPRRESAMARFSFFGLLASGVAATAMGIARRSIDELIAMAEGKRPQGSSKTLRERAPIQADVARAEAKLASAWLLMGDTVGGLWDQAVAGAEPNAEDRRSLRLAATHATETAAEVTALMYRAAGGAAVYASNPIQRCFRDAHVATQHAMVAPRTFEVAGRMRLGLDTDITTL